MSDTYRLDTPLGPVTIIPTSADHLHVSNPNDYQTVEYLTVNGVEVSLSWHLERQDDGWEPKFFYSHRADSTKGPTSASSDRKVQEVVGAAVNQWIAENPVSLNQAEEDRLATEIARHDRKIAELEDELTEEHGQRHEAEERLSRLRGVEAELPL